jgi:hypothetical protein
MKLQQIFEEKIYKIYVDLDGVLVDFDRVAEEITGMKPNEWNAKENKRKFWQSLEQEAMKGNEIWGRMPPLPDAMELWNYVKKYNPEILSATGHIKAAIPEKRAWVAKHLHITDQTKVHLVRNSKDKARFATPTSILIDDRNKSIVPWVAAGGIGILHTSAADTIKKLRKLGL